MAQNNLATFRATLYDQRSKEDGESFIKLKVPASELDQISDLPKDAQGRVLLVSVFAEQASLSGNKDRG